MKIITIIFALVLSGSVAFSQIDFKKGTVSEILAIAKEQNKPVMVDVLTDWCVWCVELDNLVYARPEIYEYANANQINYKIDAEKGEGIGFAKKYNVDGFPTILFLDPEGNEIDRINGYYPVQQFKKYMVDYSQGLNTMKDLEKKLTANPGDIESNYLMGEKKVFNNKLDEGKVHLNKVIEFDPDNRLGRKDDAEFILAYVSQKDVIAQNLESFIEANPSSDVIKDAYLELGGVYLNTIKDVTKAEKVYRTALEKFPGDEVVGLGYSRYLNSLARAIGKDPNSREDDYKRGLKYIDESLTYAKNSTAAAQAYYWQSMLYYSLGDYPQSMESIDKAIGIFDNKTYREQKEKVQKQLSSK